jgi:hypothetical protein
MPNNWSTLGIVPVGGVLLGILTAWLTTVSWKPRRFYAEHPWRVFWLIGTPLLWASLVFDIYLPLMASEPASSRALRLASVTALYSSDLVLALSAIQGLRVTRLRAPWKAALLLILALIVPFAETFSTPRPTADFLSHFYMAISISPSWGLAAWVADLVARRLVRTSHVSHAGPPDSEQVTQRREMNAQLHVPDPSPPVDGTGISKEEFGQAERVVQLYRRLVLLVGAQFVLVVVFLRIPAAAAVVVVIPVVFVWLLATLYRLMSSVGPHSPVLTVIGFCIPFVNVLVLLSVSLNAQAWCKRRGIRVGFLGPTRKSIEGLSSI